MTDPGVLERMRELALDLGLNDYAAGTLSPFALRRPTAEGGTEPAVPEGLTDPRWRWPPRCRTCSRTTR